MESRYTVIISGKNLYREVELLPSMEEVCVGTSAECEIRLHKELFFEQIELTFSRRQGEWSVFCSDNLYLSVGDVRKLMTKTLSHGDGFAVRYQNSGNEVFHIDFLIDFNIAKRKYERAIDISDCSALYIGASNNNHLVLSSPYTRKDEIVLQRQGRAFVLDVRSTSYGIYHNGRKAESGSAIKDGDFFSISDYIFYLKADKIWMEIRDDVRINVLSYQDHPNLNQYPKFSRNTRVKTKWNEEKIEILDPPAKPEKPRNNLLMRLLPSMGMLATSALMAVMGGSMVILSAITGGMAIVTSVLGVIQNKRDFKKKTAERIQKYEKYIDGKREEIEVCRDQERKTMEEVYLSQNAEKQLFADFSHDLFDRVPEDEDFLHVRLGTGSVKARREIDHKKQERLEVEDDLQTLPEQLSREYELVHNVPIVCPFKEAGAIGVVGTEERRFSILKKMVVDICARQYHSDVKLFFVATTEHKDRITWLRHLPHVKNDITGTRNIVCDDDSKNLIFEYLYKELTLREQNKKHETHIVVFFYDDYHFKSHPISKFVADAEKLGVTFVFFEDAKSEIPLGCKHLIMLRDDVSALLVDTQDKENALEFTYPTISDEEAGNIVELLAPVYTEEISLEGTLTKNISLFELLNIIAVDDLDLGKRWAASQVHKSMSAPLGVAKSGMVCLDLHDKAHGPHGLVAGTTGSGKSEILQTYILSMATLFHPYEVAFVIIDFKGGGMVNQFKELPHLLGAITNIDGKEIDRSLKSIKAELQKRQRLFAEAEVNHIDKYIQKFKAGDAATPLPHLIIIVDEFAELKAEQPEFMKELISAARIGRSLGVHLILATQKPSGQVNEQIWSNSRFKLCLKVQSQEDSNEVLKSPLAAEIKEPGRAYLQVGNNEIFELFQSAYSGTPEKADQGNVKEFAIYSLTDWGKRTPVYVQKKKKSGEGSLTQLDAVVKYVNAYAKQESLKKLPDICLPSLSPVLDFPETAGNNQTGHAITAELGIYDDPDNQYQGVYSANLSENNMMIIGSAQSGKTNLLQTLIRSIAAKYTPKEVNIYIIDFASMVLRNFESLHHVGGVVTPSEDEKLKNLMKLLYTEMETRKEKLMSIGVSSFAAYREAGKTDLPQIILMIDNLTALKELYFREDDELLRLCREGLAVGISVVIANPQTSGIGYKYLSNFACRIALFCNDSGEYSSLFDHCRERIADIHGRSIVEIDKTHLECQIFRAFEGEKEIERVREIKSFIAKVNQNNKDALARVIPVIPATLSESYVSAQFAGYQRGRFEVVVGLNYANVTPYTMNFASLGALAITGRENAGKHNFVKYVISTLARKSKNQIKVYVADGIAKKLSYLKEAPYVAAYSLAADEAVKMICQIEEELKKRYDELVSGNESIVETSPLLLMVIDNMDTVNAISADKNALTAYKNITTRYKNLNVALLIPGYENVNVPYSAPELTKALRDGRHILFFDDASNMKIFDMPLAVARAFKKPIELGDCYYIKDNEYVKLKSVKHSQEGRI